MSRNGEERYDHLGMELFHITPIVLGGDPEDPKNRAWLTRRQHIEAVRYWNRIIREHRKDLVPPQGQDG